jgi:excisionase family DNA binding protein
MTVFDPTNVNRKALGDQMETIILTINEACHWSRTGRTALYAAIKSGQLSARKRGSRTMILTKDLEQWVESFPKMRSSA